LGDEVKTYKIHFNCFRVS